MGLPRFSSAPSSPAYEHLDLDPEHTPGIHLLTRSTFLKPLHLVSPILLVLLLAYVAWHRNDANTVYVDSTTGFVNSATLELSHLSLEHCGTVFPSLYQEIDRAKKYWMPRGGVSLADLDAAELQGQARAMIYKGRLYVKSFSLLQQGTRTKAILLSINEALITSITPVPDIEFVIETGDTGLPAGAPWVLGRKAAQEQLTLLPDYGFYSWPESAVGSFQDVRDKSQAYDSNLSWGNKIHKLFWTGAPMIPLREEFINISTPYPWGAVTKLDWAHLDGHLLTPEQHCQYQFLGHVEGFAASGRLKYILQCRSVTVTHEPEYIQHFNHLFNADPASPEQNIVVVPGGGFAKLPETMQFLIDNDQRAQEIAENSIKFWRHWLSPASVECYWRRLFHTWAEMQNFTPKPSADMLDFRTFILAGRVIHVPYPG